MFTGLKMSFLSCKYASYRAEHKGNEGAHVNEF